NGTTVRVGTTALVVADIEEDVEEDDVVAHVEFFVNGQSRGTDATAPYEYALPVTAGTTTATVTARATDAAGNQSQVASLVLTVQADIAPLVAVSTSAQNNQVSSG